MVISTCQISLQMLSKRLWSLLILDPIYYGTSYWIDDFGITNHYVQIGNEVQYEKPKSHFWRQKKGLSWNDFEWIWMVRNEPCLNIFVTKTQQIRFNPAQSTKPAGSSWIFNNVQDLIFAEPPRNILECSIKYFSRLKIWNT